VGCCGLWVQKETSCSDALGNEWHKLGNNSQVGNNSHNPQRSAAFPCSSKCFFGKLVLWQAQQRLPALIGQQRLLSDLCCVVAALVAHRAVENTRAVCFGCQILCRQCKPCRMCFGMCVG
jgi:hypothetical protein